MRTAVFSFTEPPRKIVMAAAGVVPKEIAVASVLPVSFCKMRSVAPLVFVERSVLYIVVVLKVLFADFVRSHIFVQ